MSLSRDIVLLITHSNDFFTIDRVAEALIQKGAQPFRFNTDHFPLKVGLKGQFNSFKQCHTLDYQGQTVNSDQVKAVWMRRVWEPKFNQELDPKYEQPCAQESKATLEGFWDSLKEARWVDRLERINIAKNKQRQLRVASEVGFMIPRTLITNKAEAAREFFQQVDGKMVSKLLTTLHYGMEYSPFFLYTNVVKAEDLEDAESLSYCPMVFQEKIPKEKELRVIYVNGQVFVGALDALIYNDITIDWRRPGVNVGSWENHQLPEDLISRIQTFMGKFGLLYGAFDFIVTPSRDYVFLEVNPGGEWGMIEKELDLPIANAIADALIAA
ncbi:MvdC family ATP-grasp ribosomal peptide maturase [Crocosphaera sp. XPORK-15E]|uniref:MvdC family ATP-grasp ribosomal peptide maturase n=1 Tax=Crocosphaera sp. XPORK-15E TaxID=3110247 RepID=UPI002B2147FE|nr:MvdC family ATP-grasp ribosomal peptide maturase [Crocosphaera sp. XPORK-15E]MEA5536926.1 MvdC family ATP-grasp ribosomal peptide maturase [Crocosphaera sp. XPORK-15E]